MKISIRNFGPIRDFETDLDASFVLILGENNIGKSYAISLVYVILKTLTNVDLLDRPLYSSFLLDDLAKRMPSSFKEEFLKSYKSPRGKNGIDVTEVYKAALIESFKIFFLDQFEKSISGTYGDISNLENRRDANPSTIVISTGEFTVRMQIAGGKVLVDGVDILTAIFVRPSKQRRVPKSINGQRIIYGPVDDPLEAYTNIVGDSLAKVSSFAFEVSSSISDVHYLPASRSGLYQALSAFGQIIAELSKQRSFLSQRIELPAISEPLVDYFIKLTDIKPARKSDTTKFQEIADELEQRVLGGAVEFDAKSKRLFYKPYGLSLRLDLSSTSSMVSEVAPIATYIKHVLPNAASRRYLRRSRIARPDTVKRKQMLFIEEPEAHLHPKSQVLLMQSFARLASECDVKIVMTSHSNFVFNQISNLIIGKILAVGDSKAYIFSKTELGTVGRELDVDEYGISDENFAETSEAIFNEKLDLLDGLSSRQESDNAL